MKFMKILLGEGRREDLKKKYSDKFNEETLDWILSISDLVDFNHKYTDFVLKNVDPNSDVEWWVQEIIDQIKLFDKYKNQLEKKDINQYENYHYLESALLPIQQKEKEKELEKQVDKIYEDDKFVVVIPKTEESSCKYGSGTKWCTTSKGAGHFQRYTSGGQLLFYIIDKKISKPGNYEKVAVHIDNSGRESWWDTKDDRMSDREINVFKYAFSEITDAIKDYANQSSVEKKNRLLYGVFDDSGYLEKSKNYRNTDSKLVVTIQGFENVEGLDNSATAKLNIVWNKSGVPKLLDSYTLLISYGNPKYDTRYARTVFKIDVGFSGNDPNEEDDYMDFGLETWDLNSTMALAGLEETADGVRRWIVSRVLDQIENNTEFMKKITGGSAVFTPTYGYTFGRNKGMISKLIKYLDSGKIGTKLDFLTDIGYLEKIIQDGKTKYKRGNYTFDPRELRGQHASFFAAAKNAGILGYRKVGRDYLLTKGPNFDAFKEGKLKAL